MIIKSYQKQIIKNQLEKHVYCIESGYLDIVVNYLNTHPVKKVKLSNLDLFEIVVQDIKYARIIKNWLHGKGVPCLPLDTDETVLRIGITEFFHRFT